MSSDSFVATRWLAPLPLEILGVSPPAFLLANRPFAFWATTALEGLAGAPEPSSAFAGIPSLVTISDVPL